MSTEKYRNPRINLTLPEDTYKVVSEYSKVLEKPIATAVREFLIELTPTMQMTIEAAKLAESDKEKALNKLYEGFMQGIVDAAQYSLLSGDSKKNDNG